MFPHKTFLLVPEKVHGMIVPRYAALLFLPNVASYFFTALVCLQQPSAELQDLR